LIQSFTHDCTNNQEQSYQLDRVMGVHEFTVHMKVDLRAEARHDEIGNSGYALSMGPRDRTGSFYWDWDPENERNPVLASLAVKAFPSMSGSVSISHPRMFSLATSRYFVIMKSVQNFTFGLILISRRMTF
jgi:hypothetical protein